MVFPPLGCGLGDIVTLYGVKVKWENGWKKGQGFHPLGDLLFSREKSRQKRSWRILALPQAGHGFYAPLRIPRHVSHGRPLRGLGAQGPTRGAVTFAQITIS